ncbi:DNA polymerase III subunit beta [Shewanella sp. Choline-02u-19]|jgi:DNA polymerase-3 subunit beta|uniref:DNA polymerase III subunit beta n=1 Tax=Shewanella TaxID=22 RepID=UPI000C343412|nr:MULTISPECIES: DNA polymerase III subunit beta [Shewanella]MCL1059500.1 DNA polymerase III subunit beta [Shewanella gelidimarina]PKG58661.1 DNA polymerase III subunit beta [Shewanella sp. GutDb-MelDb]PKG75531.1 DNA polymerase III subunit beta [Shewanella sp. GutCb]PKH62551.1 DNA polymerase III subunit beta [Shewanella sp. Bg11-22]PKI30718.1 DNA polymerase III subunit beta [Shewanella sp. Choline-02u-19]
MKFSIDRDALLKPLQLVSGAVERRHNLPILANLLVEVSAHSLKLTGTDLEVELVGEVQLEGDVIEGRTTVPAKKFLDIVKSLPDLVELKIEQQENRLLLRSGRSRFTLATLPAEEYPNVEAFTADIEFTLKQGTMKSLIDATQFSMANQDVRYYLNGLLLETEGNVLRAIATDGHRLALSHRIIDATLPEKQVIVPRKGVLELMRSFEGDDLDVTIAIGDNAIRATTATAVFTSKLVDGRFPDYRRVLPKGGDKIVIANRLQLKQALLRASILSNEKFRGVRVQLENNLIKITANNPEQEEAEEILDVEYENTPLEIGFNVSYLLDVLNNLPSDDVRITLIDGNSSALIDNHIEQNSMYVVMPMRL